MANAGRFIDRNPSIPPAGKSSVITGVYPCLNYITLEEEVQAALSHYPKEPKSKFPEPPVKAELYTGYFSELKKLLSPPVKRVFEHLREELKETAYKSYWTKELGKLPDQVPGLLVGMDPETTVFGKPSRVSTDPEYGETLGNIIFPDRPYGEVKLEEELGLELYQRSHRSFPPGKRNDFYYDAPGNVVYGKCDLPIRTGKHTRECLEWVDQGNVSKSSKGQARFNERSHYEIGKVLRPNNILGQLGQDYVFGQRKEYIKEEVRDSIRHVPLNKESSILAQFISYITAMRKTIKKQDPPFPFFELTANLKLLDEGGCGCLPLPIVYDVCSKFGLFFDKELFEMILRHLGIIHGTNNEIVSYHMFSNILDTSKPLPELPKIADIPKEMKYYESTYKKFTDNLQEKKSEKRKAAGLPVLRIDVQEPGNASCRGDRILLVDETSVDSCIRPSIFSLYGLNHRDFLKLRTKEYMKGLWERAGVSIPDSIFNEMWKEGLTREENDMNMVCIETFRNMLDEMCEAKLTEVRDI